MIVVVSVARNTTVLTHYRISHYRISILSFCAVEGTLLRFVR